MPKGSCLCGTVRFELDGPPDLMNLCHCSMCRKVTGSAYGVFAHASTTRFAWLSGQDAVRAFESSEHGRRAFCSRCGANVPAVFDTNAHVVILAGGFDDDPGIVPAAQIFVGSKAPWHDVAPTPIAFEEFPPEDFVP